MSSIRISKWDNLDSDSDQFEDVYSANKIHKPKSFGHGHSHGGAPCSGHHEEEEDAQAELAGHGHSHGGTPCDGKHDDSNAGVSKHEQGENADKIKSDDGEDDHSKKDQLADAAEAVSKKQADVPTEKKVEWPHRAKF